MEFKELQSKSLKDLHFLLAELRENYRNMRFKIANKQLKNIREIRAIKKNISQVLTLLNRNKDNK